MKSNTEKLSVYSDRRWPLLSGIGTLRHEFEVRRPPHVELIDLEVSGKIGSPLSPLMISLALSKKAKPSRGVYYSAGFMPPLWTSLPTVVIVHDLMHLKFYGRLKRFYYDYFLRFLYRRCSAICCVSEFSRNEFIEWSGIDQKRVHVVHSMCSADFSPQGAKFDPGYEYVAYCGNHRGYKNIERLIRAYAASRLPANGVRLLITGKRNEALAAVARESGVPDDVVFTGFLPADDIPALYRGAKAIAYVSLQEGFGLPIVEAFGVGVPILTSNVSSMPEVAGDGALLVDPYSIEDIRDGLDEIVFDETKRRLLVANGFRRLENFSYDKSAAKLWSIIGSLGFRSGT